MTNPIKIGGVETFSTVDFPEKISAVIFMQGCPWCCPFCHNTALQPSDADTGFVWSKFIDFLKSRRGMIDAVTFSGGEPLMQNGLQLAMEEVKSLGYQIGLHTGGYRSEHLAKILPLVDWVGFDIKAPFNKEKYAQSIGGINQLDKVLQSLDWLIASGVDFECRTTCDPRILSIDDIYEIADSLKNKSVKKYFLQKYRPIASDTSTQDVDCEMFFLDTNLLSYLETCFSTFDIRK